MRSLHSAGGLKQGQMQQRSDPPAAAALCRRRRCRACCCCTGVAVKGAARALSGMRGGRQGGGRGVLAVHVAAAVIEICRVGSGFAGWGGLAGPGTSNREQDGSRQQTPAEGSWVLVLQKAQPQSGCRQELALMLGWPGRLQFRSLVCFPACLPALLDTLLRHSPASSESESFQSGSPSNWPCSTCERSSRRPENHSLT